VTAPAPSRADGLVHPVPIAAIALLVLNDHWAKYAFPGFVTGKLSDVAGMVFFPLLLQALVELVDRREPFRPRRSVLVGSAIATGLVFGATNLSATAAEAYRVGLGVLQWPFRAVLALLSGGAVPDVARVHLTQDPTDVLTVPFVLVAVAVGWRRTRG
jgi:hypothetical protein